jgi:hypothetical protein
MDRRNGQADSIGGPQDRPARGSLAELRLRLEGLPPGHPSSPYDDQGARKPSPQQLRQLELPLADEERESDPPARASLLAATAGDRNGVASRQLAGAGHDADRGSSAGLGTTVAPGLEPRPSSNGTSPGGTEPAHDWASGTNGASPPAASAQPDHLPGSKPYEGLTESSAPSRNGARSRDSVARASDLARPGKTDPYDTDPPYDAGALYAAGAPYDHGSPGGERPPPNGRTDRTDAFSSNWRDRDSGAGRRNGHSGGHAALGDLDTPVPPAAPPAFDGAPGQDSSGAGRGSSGVRGSSLGNSGGLNSGGLNRAGLDSGGLNSGGLDGAGLNRADDGKADYEGADFHGTSGQLAVPAPADQPSAEHRSGLTAEQEQIANRALGRYKAADGRNVFGGYGESGLTPAIRRVEAHLPHGRLSSETDEHRLKSPERFKEKLAKMIARSPGVPAEELAAEIYDAARYTFLFEPQDYTDGTWLVHRRLKSHGFELEARRNRWESPEFKGIRTRWRDPAHDLAFEVQFHTPASWDVVQRTHGAYLRITDVNTPAAERAQLRARQVAASAATRPPPRSAEIGDFRTDAR